MDAAVEDDRSIFPIGHAELLGAREARQRDLPRRRLPGALIGLGPTMVLPARPELLKGRTLIVTDAVRSQGKLDIPEGNAALLPRKKDA